MQQFKKYITKTTSIAPLITFRIGFGLVMFFSIFRFWNNGWIEKLYINPEFHFSFYGFSWVKPLGDYTYVIFIICALSALFVAIGLRYKIAIITFFLSFTYIELMDKTTYLNHYYFISLISFILIFLPANKSFSIDAFLNKKEYTTVPRYTIDSIKLMLSIVYFYAGLAKINSDWLYNAMPLKIWLPSKYSLPFLGETLMHQNWFHYAMSWSGMFYDLLIPFSLLYKKTRWFAFAMVVFFHLFTRILFPIGMFPFIMIISTLIFFDADFHTRIITFFRKKINRIFTITQQHTKKITYKKAFQKIHVYLFILFFSFQLLIPFRYLLYPGELFWTEQGFRFSWRVMLIEKMGYTTFKVVEPSTGIFFYVDNTMFLTPFQEKQMSFQPDFILEYAHFLGDYYTKKGYKNVEIYTDSYVALNGRISKRFIDKNVNLYQEKESFKNKNWILPFNDEIKGF